MARVPAHPLGDADGEDPGPERRELARGTAELCVLAVLEARRCYGYELLRVLQRTGTGVLEVREGALYPLLHRLEDAGWIVATWEASGRSRPRKYYEITLAGTERLSRLRGQWRELIEAVEQLFESLTEVTS